MIIKTATKEECLNCLLKKFPQLQIKEISEVKTGYSYSDPKCTKPIAKYKYIDVIGYDKADTYHNCNLLYSATGTSAIAVRRSDKLIDWC